MKAPQPNEQPALEYQRFAWSYTVAQRPSHKRENSILDNEALAIDLLLAER
jgi:hypothetical protein